MAAAAILKSTLPVEPSSREMNLEKKLPFRYHLTNHRQI